MATTHAKIEIDKTRLKVKQRKEYVAILTCGSAPLSDDIKAALAKIQDDIEMGIKSAAPPTPTQVILLTHATAPT
jgi:ferredoxin-NADP reductase